MPSAKCVTCQAEYANMTSPRRAGVRCGRACRQPDECLQQTIIMLCQLLCIPIPCLIIHLRILVTDLLSFFPVLISYYLDLKTVESPELVSNGF